MVHSSRGGDSEESLFQAALDTLPLNIALLDTDGTILTTNTAWQEFATVNDLPIQPDTVGVNYLDVCDRADDQTAQDAAAGIRAVMAGERSVFELEYPCHSPDEQRWFLLRATQFTHDQTAYVSVAHLNITARKHAELETEQTIAQLEDERETLALLNQIVRHDLRNDANVIAGWADLLADSGEGERHDELRRIEETATQMAELTQTAADLTHTLTTASEDELQAINLTDILDFQLEKVAQTSSSHTKQVTIDDSAVPDTDICVLADEMVTAVFSNILSNAVFHTQTEPVEITVSVEQAADADTVTVRIADNGPGIPDSAKETVFGRGEKGLASDGTGLGLYLVNRLITRYNGAVQITDNTPTGTVVHLTFHEAVSKRCEQDGRTCDRHSTRAN